MSQSNNTPAARPSWRGEIVLMVLGLLGFLIFFTQYDRAFPQGALDLKLSRAQVAALAGQTLAEYGVDPQPYESVLTFGHDSSASIYLQNTLGIPETNRRIQAEDLPIWYWQARWFQPLEKEEFRLYFSPAGQVVGFQHSVLETDPGAALEQEQARQVAEDYLVSLGWELADWEEISASSTERPGGRVDHDFQWKRRQFSAGEAELRLTVNVLGDQVGGYDYWLKTPETFWRDFSEKQNLAGFIANACILVGWGAIPIGAAIVAAIFLTRGLRTTRRAMLPALVVAVIGLLASLNYLVLSKSYYPTTQAYPLFWVEQVFSTLMGALAVFVVVAVFYLCAISVNLLVWPGRDVILPRGDRWLNLARSVWRGLAAGGVACGYVIIFYYLATQVFGGWTPMQTEYSNLFATPVPAMAALDAGMNAAMLEELPFRLLGIGLLLWLLRGRLRWLALLIPALVWAFAHSTYVRDPIYLRGVEITFMGLFYGYLMLKYDLTTTITAHASFNALLTILPMLRSGEPYFVLNGVLVIAVFLAPVAVGLGRWLRGRRGAASAPRLEPAIPADLPALQALPLPGVDWQAGLAGPGSAVCCLRAGEELVGAALGRVAEGGEAQVQAVYVAPEWRRQYWGTRLVQALDEQLKALGATAITASTAVKEHGAGSFWASQGWQPARITYAQANLPTVSDLWQALRNKLRRRK